MTSYPRGLHARSTWAQALFRGSLLAVALFTLTLSLATAQSGATPPTGVIGWWAANGDATDSIGNNDGALLNGATFAPSIVTDGTGQAFLFDGVNDMVSVPDDPSLDITGAISAAAWVNVVDYNCHDTRRVVSKLSYPPLSGWSLDIMCDQPHGGALTGALRIQIFDNSTLWFSETSNAIATVPLNEWTHVGFTWDGIGTVRLYIDGEIVREQTWAPGVMGDIGAHSRPLEIGRWGSAYFKGAIDEVMVFDRELTRAEMVGLHAPGEPVILDVTSADAPVEVGSAVAATASFIDTDGNTSSGTFDWGDGTTSAATIDASAGTATGSHSYSAPGVYTITVTLSDGDGNTGSDVYEFVVVYDPDGGFVTGAGSIDSPAGACNWSGCDSSTTGKATFGFVSKYNQGNGWQGSGPSGNSTFVFHAGDLRFQSIIQDWLVVAGQDKAKFKGSTGQIGSAGVGQGGDFGYMITVVDNGSSGDTFRIKIWDNDNNGEVVYDNKMGVGDDGYDGTQISSGNIKVHK